MLAGVVVVKTCCWRSYRSDRTPQPIRGRLVNRIHREPAYTNLIGVVMGGGRRDGEFAWISGFNGSGCFRLCRTIFVGGHFITDAESALRRGTTIIPACEQRTICSPGQRDWRAGKSGQGDRVAPQPDSALADGAYAHSQGVACGLCGGKSGGGLVRGDESLAIEMRRIGRSAVGDLEIIELRSIQLSGRPAATDCACRVGFGGKGQR